MRTILIFSGTISLIIGIAGIFIPVLPTTPFLLLTAGLYARSSDRLHQLLLRNRITGPFITKFRSRGGMTLRQKVWSITLMWVMIGVSLKLIAGEFSSVILLVSLGVTGSVVMGFIIPTAKQRDV